jgi:hypothetical protein
MYSEVCLHVMFLFAPRPRLASFLSCCIASLHREGPFARAIRLGLEPKKREEKKPVGAQAEAQDTAGQSSLGSAGVSVLSPVTQPTAPRRSWLFSEGSSSSMYVEFLWLCMSRCFPAVCLSTFHLCSEHSFCSRWVSSCDGLSVFLQSVLDMHMNRAPKTESPSKSMSAAVKAFNSPPGARRSTPSTGRTPPPPRKASPACARVLYGPDEDEKR